MSRVRPRLTGVDGGREVAGRHPVRLSRTEPVGAHSVPVHGRNWRRRSAAGWALAALLLVAACSAKGPAQPSALKSSAPALGFSLPATPSATPTTSPTPPPPPQAGPNDPCVGAAHPAAWEHVVWIWFENKPTSAVLGSTSAPYISTLAARCLSGTNYHGVTHPSLPNYLAATSGSTQGVADDSAPAVHPIAGPSLFGQVSAAGKQWRAYQEAMPSPCASISAGRYAVKHNPAAYYTAIHTNCARWDVGGENLTNDLQQHALPAFAFVTPDLCHDMHDCTVDKGDAWLKATLPALLSSPEYLKGTTAVFIVWDEDGTTQGSNQVPLIALAPSVVGGTSVGAPLDHYSLLRTTENMLGLAPLGAAANALAVPGL